MNSIITAGNVPAIIPFNFEGTAVRVLDQSGEPWWVLADVCKVLEIANAPHAASRLDDDEKTTIANNDSQAGSGAQAYTIINESGLWSLVLTSRKPAAKRFKKWITSEVIPSIRKTGGYMAAAPEETPEEIMLRALTIAKETVDRQKNQIAELSPKAAALDAISEAEGDMGVRDAGRELGIGVSKVVEFLLEHKWACREGEKKKKLRPAHYGLTQGYCRLVPKTYPERHTGETCVGHDFKITPRGLARLAVLLCGINSEPARRLNGAKKATPVPFSQTPA